jgi:GT2 family glycosyltransferase
MTVSSPSAPDSRDSPKVSVVIPNHNGATWLPRCLDGLARQEYRDFEVILVDDGSTDESVALVRDRFPNVRPVVLDNNTGFASAVNRGIATARGTYVVLLNNDTVAEPGWLAALAGLADTSPADVVAIASKMLRMEDPERIDDAGDTLSWMGDARKLGHEQPAAVFMERREVFSVCAGAALYRRSFLKEIGGFDERFFAYLEDVDLGLRGRLLGYRYLFEPAARVLHQGQGTGLSRSLYVRLITRNRMLLFLKNVPLSLLVKRLPQILRGQVHFFLAYRKPWQSLAGYASLLGCVPHIWRERARMRSSRRIPAHQLDAMLANGTGAPPS